MEGSPVPSMDNTSVTIRVSETVVTLAMSATTSVCLRASSTLCDGQQLPLELSAADEAEQTTARKHPVAIHGKAGSGNPATQRRTGSSLPTGWRLLDPRPLGGTSFVAMPDTGRPFLASPYVSPALPQFHVENTSRESPGYSRRFRIAKQYPNLPPALSSFGPERLHAALVVFPPRAAFRRKGERSRMEAARFVGGGTDPERPT